MKLLAIVQARMGSVRFPGKVMARVGGKPLIEVLLYRLSRSKLIDKIVLATSENIENDPLVSFTKQLGYQVYRGSEYDVLDRFYRVVTLYRPEAIVRITGDCPIIDPGIVDKVVGAFFESAADYASNIDPPTWPDGLDVEIFSSEVLKIAWNEAAEKFDREHVTPFIRAHPKLTKINLSSDRDYSSERWTIDEFRDFEVISNIIEHFSPNLDFEVVRSFGIKEDTS